MLFADVKNYSKLHEAQAPAFFATFLREVADVIDSLARPPVFRNTWGDGLFLVFDGATGCGEFALRLLRRVVTVDWTKLGLPADTTVRIGVHARPVFRHRDAIIERDNFFGSHVNRAARIEPVTPPGAIFASEQFAASLAVEREPGLLCEWVGVEWLAKEYDRVPLYGIVGLPARPGPRSVRYWYGPRVRTPKRNGPKRAALGG